AQLQGRAAGVVVSSTGQPGASAVVRIRGFQSFGNNNPLYIIDGVPTEDPSLLNPQDIESIQVLKDATSAAIYGTRAANGVIIVTTRQGKVGRTQVTYESFAGVQVVTDKMKPDLLNNMEYIEYLQRTTGPTFKHPVFGQNGSFAVPERIVVSSGFKGGTTASDPRADPSLYTLEPGKVYQIYNTDPAGTNWHDAITRNAPMQSHQLTATSGTDKALYSMGINYYDQKGTFLNTGYKRYTVRANSSFKPTNFFRFGENFQISYEERLGGDNRGEGGAWAQAYRMVPYIPIYDIGGGWGGNGMGESGNGTNPVAQLFRSKDNTNKFTKLFGNVFGEVLFTKNLTLRSSMGMDMGSQFETIISRRTYERAENQGTTQYREQGWRYTNWTWTNTLNYQQIFGQHDVRVLLGSEAIRRRSRGVTAQAQNFDFEDVNFISLNTGVARTLGDVSLGNYNVGASNIYSLFGRLDYAFAGKYLLNATVRRDGASVFGPTTRYGTFPSIGLGWRISEEGFMKGIGWLNDLKLRGGFGRVGSISNVPGLNQFSTLESNPNRTNYDINGGNTSSTQGYRVDRLGNLETRWETTETKNVGIDAAFLQNKWEVTVNVYRNDTKDLLVPRLRNSLEPVVAQPQINIGTMRNQGYEISVNNKGNITGDLRYDVSLNFSRYTNELIKLNEAGTPLFIGLERLSNALITRAGDPVSSFWGYVIDGFYNSQGEIDKGPTMSGATVGSWRFKDINGDGKITSDDRTILGSPHPDFQLGTNIGLNWKNFDFMAFLFWNQGNQIWNHTKYFTDMRVFVGGVSKRVLTDSWTPQNMNATLPRLGTGTENGYTSFVTSNPSSYFVEDGSYLRAKTVQLGYRLPKSLISSARLSNARVYVQAQNLFTITKYTGADPDVQLIQNGQGDQYIGVDRAGFPNPKQFLFGLNVTF
ncbi:MAG: SusC/RagA family TonB-linked outer membrane protein, partial [Segetibacter sp.]